ncbi:MAG: DMT family transporter [Synergistaceae bacterium]|jgi:drug/metabolite transporter (DMT)-like permease|nr:DMT family transporter [Synergistaceae bacterium]
MGNRLRMMLGDGGVLTVAFIWGATNVVLRGALTELTPLWFCALRFAVAFAATAVFFGRRAVSMPRAASAAGFFTGAVFILAHILGAIALLFTTAGNESFIIAMSVVFVPLAAAFMERKAPPRRVIASIALCVAGMAGLMLDGSMSVNVGDLLCFASMLLVTAYILLVQKFVKSADVYALAFWQALGGMTLAAAAALIFEPMPSEIPYTAWAAVAYAGTVGFALTLVIQNVAQKYTTATHTAILLSMSSVFGRVLGIVFIEEPMTPRIFTASALILAGVITAELAPGGTGNK